MSKHFIYLARCSDNSLYVGYTEDIEHRIKRHNEGEGSRYTKHRRPINVVYTEEFDTSLEARRRELQIKRWTRAKKENLVKHGHPTKF